MHALYFGSAQPHTDLFLLVPAQSSEGFMEDHIHFKKQFSVRHQLIKFLASWHQQQEGLQNNLLEMFLEDGDICIDSKKAL